MLYEIKSTALTRIQEAAVGWSAPHLLFERGASLLPEKTYKLRFCYRRDSPELKKSNLTVLTRKQEAALGWSAPQLLRERGASQPRPLARENLYASTMLRERLSKPVELKSITHIPGHRRQQLAGQLQDL